MLTLTDKATQLDDLLDKMAEAIQLDRTRYERMIKTYGAVKTWIESDDKFFKPYKYDVYPHGSVRIRTTVKPIGRDEFDLDIAIHLIPTTSTSHSPEKIYRELKRRLEENEAYKRMLEAKTRCIRLNYSGDFHMDILPGVQEYSWDENRIKIPDRDMGTWVSSNPRGYASWFLAKANLAKSSLLEKALKAENLPADEFENKKPLQRAVQLIKRMRDIYFQKDDTYKTSSIILTTIAGHAYQGEESIFEAIDQIILNIYNQTSVSVSRIKILNPVNQDEDFTDKWEEEPKYYEHFKSFCSYLFQKWQQLKAGRGVIEEGQALRSLFGDDLYTGAQLRQTDSIENLRRTNQLGINRDSGMITLKNQGIATPLKANTFFGHEK